MRAALKTALLFFWVGTTSWAQGTAQINGAVRDAAGLAVPDAEVKATLNPTGASRSATSGNDGGHVCSNPPIGPYRRRATTPRSQVFLEKGDRGYEYHH